MSTERIIRTESITDEVDLVYKEILHKGKVIYKYTDPIMKNPRITGRLVYLRNGDITTIPNDNIEQDKIALYYNGSGRLFSLHRKEYDNIGKGKINNWSIR